MATYIETTERGVEVRESVDYLLELLSVVSSRDVFLRVTEITKKVHTHASTIGDSVKDIERNVWLRIGSITEFYEI